MSSKQRSSSKFGTRQRVNVRMVLCFLGACVVVGGLVHLLHGFQLDKNADALKQRAVQLQGEGESSEAIRRYRQYVKLRPNDLEVWIALGELLTEAAQTPQQYLRLYLANEQVLRLDPTNDTVRRRQAETAMTLRRFRDAIEHWTLLQKSAQDDGELEFQIGLCEEYSGETTDAISWYRKALGHGYDRPLVFLRMARLQHRRLKQPAEADKTIQRMMQAHPDSAEAYRTRALYRRAFGNSANALADAREAANRAPDNVEFLLLVAELTIAEPDVSSEALNQLLATFESRLKESPGETRIHDLLSRIQIRLGNRQQAIEILRRGRDAAPEQSELAWQLADLLIAEGHIDDARDELDRLRTQEAPETPLMYLEARILMADGEFVQAKKRLERVQKLVDRDSMLYQFTGLHLGACYGRMGQYGEQLDACRQVLEANPQSIEAKLGSAAALESLGRADDAIQIYEKYRLVSQVPLRLARLLFNRELRRPASERNWQQVEHALIEADTATPGSVEVALLQSAVQRVQGNSRTPQPTLETLKSDPPTDIRIWVAAAMSSMRNDNWESSLKMLDEAEEQLGDSVTLRLARAAYWSRFGDQKAEVALQSLEGNLKEFPKNEQLRLLEGLATVHFLRSNTRIARRLWTDVAARYPDHVRAQFRLLRLAVGLADEEEVDRRLQELERIEGKDGPHVLTGTALHLIAQARAGKPVNLDQPSTLLIRAALEQPGWAMVPMAQAEIEELNGNLNGALEHYLRAIELENRDPVVLRRTFALLLSRRRVAEARRLIARLFENTPVSVQGQLRQLQVEISIALGDLAAARKQIPIAAAADTKNVSLLLWRGRMLAATNQSDAAAQTFESAIQLAPENPEVRVERVTFLARSGRTAAAQAAVEQARKQLKGPGTERALARCSEVTGNREQAEQYYLKLLAAGSKSLEDIRAVVDFYLRTSQSAKAEPLLTRLLDGKGADRLSLADLFWARRSLAAAKASQDYRQFREALALLDQNIKSSEDSIDDQRLKARLLATRPHPNELRDARRILESLEPRNQLRPADRRLLANICDRIGDKSAAVKNWEKLVTEVSDQPMYVAEYINRLLRQKDVDEAEHWLERLTKLEPDSLRTTALRARWLVVQHRTDDSLKLLKAYVEKLTADEGTSSQRVLRVAQVLERLAGVCDNDNSRDQLIAGAETLYQGLIEKHPESLLPLAMFLSRQERREEALDHCERALQSLPITQVTAAAVVIVRHPSAGGEQIARVEQWLTNAVQEDPDSVAVQVQLAEFFLSHDRYEESAEIYEKILKRIPNHIVALNNLAWLLSVWKGDHATAEKMVQRAIDQVGPIPALLDTRGSIAINSGEVMRAVDDFRDVVAQDSSAAARYHLALAYWKSDNLPAARFNFEMAKQAGLTADDLYPLERDDYEKLSEIVQSDGSPARDR